MPKALPGKSAAKKVAKKAAKKVAAKAPHKAAKKSAKSPAEDTRKAYEHLCRLRAMGQLLDQQTTFDVQLLSRYARAAFSAEQARAAAHLLRAAEHLAFSRQVSASEPDAVSKELKQALREELEHRLERAVEHWEGQESKPAQEFKALYKTLRRAAKDLWQEGHLARALESARAAEALAHAEPGRLQLQAAAENEASRLLEL